MGGATAIDFTLLTPRCQAASSNQRGYTGDFLSVFVSPFDYLAVEYWRQQNQALFLVILWQLGNDHS